MKDKNGVLQGAETLWDVALLVIAFIALCIWLHIGFDKWYINWLMK